MIVLIIVNCGLLGFFWYNAYHAQKKENAVFRGPAFDYLSKELRLTPAQKSQYEKMRLTHRLFVDSVNDRSRTLRDSFFEQIKNPDVLPARVNAIEQRIAADMAAVDTSTFYHFSRFRKILRPDQQQRFDQIIRDVLRGMAGPGPAGPNRPGKQPAAGDQEDRRMGPPRHGRFRQGPPPDGRRPPFGRPGGGPPPDDMPPPPDGPPPGGPPPGGPPPPIR